MNRLDPKNEAYVFCQGYEAGFGSETDMRLQFDTMVDTYGGEVLLYVWKPRYKFFLDAKASWTGVKKSFEH